MRFVKKLSFCTILLFSLFVILPRVAKASEGQFELLSTVGKNTRCFALSTPISPTQYHINVDCRNLIYPADENNSQYIIWSRNGSDVVKLGALGQGRVFFNTKTAFSQLFVTLEPNDKIKDPGNRIVMSGTVKNIAFLDAVSTPSPTQSIENPETVTDVQNPTLTPEKDVPELSTREKLLIGIKRSSVIAGVALLGLIGLIFVITRSRG